MPLELNRLQSELKKGSKKGVLNLMMIHQNRLKFHTVKNVSSVDPSNYAQPLNNFLAMAKNLLPHDKFKLFEAMFRYPVKTNEITGICFDKLHKIFDGRNPVFNYQFANAELAADWEAYRHRRLQEPDIWHTVAWEYFKSEINSVLVVDIARDQKSELPEPYFYWLKVQDIITYDAKPNGQMNWIVFRRDKFIVVLDDTSYRVWENKKNTDIISGQPIIESTHDLGYCPARFFWSNAISLDQPDIKESPISSVLESLDWFLFFHISKRQLDLMGAYPILSGYEPNCDYSNAENGDYCDGGYLKNKDGHYILDNAGILKRCPKCGSKRTVGPGSFVEIPVPNGQDQPDLRNPVQMLQVDKDALEYNVNEENRLREDIIRAVVGQAEEITTRDAFNEQQVQALFESQSNVLRKTKEGIETAQTWVDSTICLLRYGKNFISANIDYGTQFFLYTAAQLRELYKTAKEAGATESELDALQNQILETEYKNDSLQLQRMKILAELEPYRHLTVKEVTDLYKEGLILEKDLIIKLNFSNFVRKFERENINVLEFGNAISYDKKIDKITEVFAQYADALKTTE